MQELLHVAIEPVNLLYTSLLVLVLVYWLSVILGALDVDALDFDVDADADVDVDADLDADVDADAGWLASALHFFNFGKLPFMVIISVVIVTAWTLSVLSNYYLGGGSWGFALALFIPILFLSFLVAKMVTTPLVPVFERLNTEAKPVDYIGQVCRLRLPASSSHFGQAEVNIDGDHLLVNVKTDSDDLSLSAGEEALIVGKTPDGRYYLIRKLEEF